MHYTRFPISAESNSYHGMHLHAGLLYAENTEFTFLCPEPIRLSNGTYWGELTPLLYIGLGSTPHTERIEYVMTEEGVALYFIQEHLWDEYEYTAIARIGVDRAVSWEKQSGNERVQAFCRDVADAFARELGLPPRILQSGEHTATRIRDYDAAVHYNHRGKIVHLVYASTIYDNDDQPVQMMKDIRVHSSGQARGYGLVLHGGSVPTQYKDVSILHDPIFAPSLYGEQIPENIREALRWVQAY
ncbi:MAG: hypothetical protein Q4P78_04525 [Rothia sp. (in: high G+C Gram-positive bacteria)]|uniref:hypothetical protein n=1 Tax=Rothia sp. (in: high G+C Gram-positive bacteria) TaxID=1885016 RepID=UPI0026DF301A|nr:hypothetical protein [Rothia sp. (in: high G+C Gram-positive bacteria)]MDO5750455.1 hypothetical protein [Rothia sp. (in: high G+C Gram-positive bacteria)]